MLPRHIATASGLNLQRYKDRVQFHHSRYFIRKKHLELETAALGKNAGNNLRRSFIRQYL